MLVYDEVSHARGERTREFSAEAAAVVYVAPPVRINHELEIIRVMNRAPTGRHEIARRIAPGMKRIKEDKL